MAASAGLLLPRWTLAWAADSGHPVLCWKLEETGDLALESVSGTKDAIASRTGHAIWVGEGRNRALRLDGYSVWLRHNASQGILRGNAMTAMAWVALESYPVNEAALVELETKSITVFRFSVDRLGYLQFGHHPADVKSICKSPQPVPRAQWVHLAATVGDSGISLYKDGELFGQLPSARSKSKLPENATFVLGGAPDCPMSMAPFQPGSSTACCAMSASTTERFLSRRSRLP